MPATGCLGRARSWGRRGVKGKVLRARSWGRRGVEGKEEKRANTGEGGGVKLGSSKDLRARKRTEIRRKEDNEEREEKEDDTIKKRTILSKHFFI